LGRWSNPAGSVLKQDSSQTIKVIPIRATTMLGLKIANVSPGMSKRAHIAMKAPNSQRF